MTGSLARRPRASRGSSGPRIVAGALRGRRLTVADGVRPTESRLREALFSIWLDRLAGCRFLDLFAGSGAVGIEALSRGADHAVFVEGSARVLAALRRNLSGLEPSAWRLQKARLPAGLARETGIYDLVFADPPYAFNEHEALLAGLTGRLAPGGEIALEHSRRVVPTADPELWRLADRRSYGDSCLSFFRSAEAT